ncbi:hypothetical protein B0H66DRAFT_602472 [Apodospora peruviana]|uniref:Uncharacterized protein n=1 Tax=Apodospora peruviana TaxID=516989 RepID=A0AAE0M934_9PEZI|nr:hypothetical protein B0H66DRAFT_602472 [Apodospora peruviana]
MAATARPAVAYAVFAGFESSYSRGGLLPEEIEQTSTRAEIEALSRGVETVREIMLEKAYVKDVYIATDFKPPVNAMTVWMSTWLKNGGRRTNGAEVAHFPLLVDIFLRLNAIFYAAGGEGQGKPVKLRYIPRKRNMEADRLVNQTFNENFSIADIA